MSAGNCCLEFPNYFSETWYCNKIIINHTLNKVKTKPSTITWVFSLIWMVWWSMSNCPFHCIVSQPLHCLCWNLSPSKTGIHGLETNCMEAKPWLSVSHLSGLIRLPNSICRSQSGHGSLALLIWFYSIWLGPWMSEVWILHSNPKPNLLDIKLSIPVNPMMLFTCWYFSVWIKQSAFCWHKYELKSSVFL